MQVLVLGAGVIGLTSAVRLAEAGHAVEVWARDRPARTTSAVAAAIWYPYRADPADRVLRWGEATLRTYVRLADDASTGVVLRDGLEVFREPAPDPWWGAIVPGVRRARPEELQPGFADGYAMRLPVVDMSVYFGWLERRAVESGVRLVERTVGRLGDAAGAADVVVNCTGLGAREVASDPEVYGVRGQVQVVDAPDVDRFLLDEAALTYVIPRVADVVLGGTADERAEDMTVDPAAAADIRARCIEAVPALGSAPVQADRVGIRPCRSAVRLEAEVVAGTPVVHNYGHGGSGVTLSWGCADEVVRLVGASA